MSSRLYPIGIQNFEKIRKEGYLYIDKTALIHQMVTTGNYYFLSRPRRFGKSLLVSTVEAYFQGKKELFEGLAMASLEKEWLEHPIFHMDLNLAHYSKREVLEHSLSHYIEGWEDQWGKDERDETISDRFVRVIRRAYERTGRKVVILVDEYDKPMIHALRDQALRAEFRSVLKPFYRVLETMDDYIRFVLITGVTEFGRINVFDDLHQMEDITLDDRYAEICGFTEQEIQANLEASLREFALKQDWNYEKTCHELGHWYDGYHFSGHSAGVYNPFGFLIVLSHQRIESNWCATGTPSYLVELLKRWDCNLYDLFHARVHAKGLLDVDLDSPHPIPVIYQSGYLTIKAYDPEFGVYTLGFPNREVEQGFVGYLLPHYSSDKRVDSAVESCRLVQSVRRGDVDAFLERLQSFFADTPYELARDLELHYQNVLFIVFRLVGLYTQVEYHTNRGRIDLVLKTDRYIYIMEFKLDGTAEEALRQIEEKGYADPFAHDGREVIRVGVNFSSAVRNIERWIVVK